MITKKNLKILQSIPALLIVIGLIAGGFFLYKNQQKFIESASSSSGIVIKKNAGPFHVSVQFKAQDGQEYTFVQNGFVWFSEGEKVDVLYLKEDPKYSARVKSFGSLWGGLVVIAIVLASLLSMAFSKKTE